MHAYRGRLYVSSSGWYSTPFPASELIRVNDDDTWDLVVGDSQRATGGECKYPISGQPDGFENILKAHFWRAEEHQGVLCVGTNDWSWSFRHFPLLHSFLREQYGFDVYGTCGGEYWWPATVNAFGKGRHNFGARTMASTPWGGFVGSANHVRGTTVWRTENSRSCGPLDSPRGPRASARGGARGVSAPQRLIADVQPCGTALSWEPSASRRVRAGKRRSCGTRAFTRSRPAVWVQGPIKTIGSTAATAFVDRDASPGDRYLYHVSAERTSGHASEPSNLVVVPSQRPAATLPRWASPSMRSPSRRKPAVGVPHSGRRRCGPCGVTYARAGSAVIVSARSGCWRS